MPNRIAELRAMLDYEGALDDTDIDALLDCAEALQKLTFVARTSGGTAGRDEDLVAACEQAEAALTALNGERDAG